MSTVDLSAELISRDTLFSGKLYCLQHRDGYRFSVDAVLLPHFINPPKNARILDLGAGCGIMSLLLAYRRPDVKLVALELQDGLFSLINQNIELNNLKSRIEPISGDLGQIEKYLQAESFDYIVCNPPYGKVGGGRQNVSTEQAIARHEVKATIDNVARSALYALKKKGKAAFVYPAERAAVLIYTLKKNGLEPKRLQTVYSYPGSNGKLVLLEAVKEGGEELKILPPFFIYKEPGGEYSQEMAERYR